MSVLKRNVIVVDCDGNHFRVLRVDATKWGDLLTVESVATKQIWNDVPANSVSMCPDLRPR